MMTTLMKSLKPVQWLQASVIEKTTKPKLAFTTEKQLFKFTVVGFSTSAPAKFGDHTVKVLFMRICHF